MVFDSIVNRSLFKKKTKVKMEPVSSQVFPFNIFVLNLDKDVSRWESISQQLNNLGMYNHQRFPAVNGRAISRQEFYEYGITDKVINHGLGEAGCAASHIALLRYIRDNNLGWSLILEDDAVLHPNFVKLFAEYWKDVPREAKIVYAGWWGWELSLLSSKPVMTATRGWIACTHGYLVSAEGARELLNALTKVNWAIDLKYMAWVRRQPKNAAVIFNGRAEINGEKPLKFRNEHKLFGNGLIYQNRHIPSTIWHASP